MVSLRQLRYLESLAKTRHFSHAAQACAVSQPALSMQIKELEDELSVSLVERRKAGIELTAQGEEIARRAREAWDRGATEVCMQGGIEPSFTGQTYLEICAAVRQAVPGMHIHAFSPLEVHQGAATLGVPVAEFLTTLKAAGLGAVGWLDDPNTAKIAVIAVNVWMGVPFMMVAVLGGLQSIPGELYEAAEVDGATPWQRFRNVTLPGLRSVSATVVLLGIIWTFNMFAIIYLVAGPNPNTRILVTYAFERFFPGASRDFAVASTYGVLILSVLLVFAGVYRRALRKQGEVW